MCDYHYTRQQYKRKEYYLTQWFKWYSFLTLNYQPKTNLYVSLISCPLLFCISYILNCIANISKIFEIYKFLRNYFINYFITLSLSVFYCIVRKSSVKADFKCCPLERLSITAVHQPMLSIEFVIIPIET